MACGNFAKSIRSLVSHGRVCVSPGVHRRGQGQEWITSQLKRILRIPPSSLSPFIDLPPLFRSPRTISPVFLLLWRVFCRSFLREFGSSAQKVPFRRRHRDDKQMERARSASLYIDITPCAFDRLTSRENRGSFIAEREEYKFHASLVAPRIVRREELLNVTTSWLAGEGAGEEKLL